MTPLAAMIRPSATMAKARSAGVRAFINGIDRVTEPLYRPLRRVLPNIGAIDLAPLVVVIIIIFLRSYLLPGILMEVGPTIT